MDYNLEVDIVCSPGIEQEVTAEYRKLEATFFFIIKSKYACAQDLGRLSVIFHQYRILIMLTALVLGIFCNYWGMKYLSYTLRLIGFTMCFMFAFFVLNALFYEGELKSREDVQGHLHVSHFGHYGSSRSLGHRAAGGLPQLHIQYFNKLGSWG